MILPEQIRAARAYLDWSRDDLAEKSGMTGNTIKNIEDGAVQPHMATIQAIESVFREHHIDFLPNGGVCRRDNTLRVITEGDAYLQVLDDVFATLKDTGGEVLFAFVCNQLSPPAVVESDLRLRRMGIRFRSLIGEGDTYCLYPLREYRVIPKRFFHNNVQVIYGDKVASMLNNDTKSIIIWDAGFTDIQRKIFNLIWNSHQMPKETTAPVTYE